MKVNDVFIVGGLPTVTYISRDDYALEMKLRNSINSKFKLISVSGSTKSGKTVLCRSVLQLFNNIWLSGSDISTEDDFWILIQNKLHLPVFQSKMSESIETETISANAKGELNCLISKASGSVSGAQEKLKKSIQLELNNGLFKNELFNYLIESKTILVIDDFHYISPEIQKFLIRALKNPIFDGLITIILSIPHRAYDPITVEREMTGRVQQILIPQWKKNELENIAKKGFAALNVFCEESIINCFSDEAFNSPHLMQEFCLKICLENDIDNSQNNKIINSSFNYKKFFSEVAEESTSKPAFNLLAKGPKSRSQRTQYEFLNGSKGDIYLAVLSAIALTGPKTELTYEEIRTTLKNVLEKLPQINQITRVFAHMSAIARDIGGEPILEWAKNTRTLYI
ncbi:MAG: hypothetical protein PHR06_09965 [Candidatus Cloacimonetes bacterium]|nr:hypothetical protein [Candidatus Cloacimonadota bacterium]